MLQGWSGHEGCNVAMLTISLLGMGCLARLANIAPRNRCATRSSNPCEGCHSKAMAVQLTLQSSANVQPYFVPKQANILQKMELGFSMFEGYRDEVKKSVDEGRVHVDDVVALLKCHAVGDFDVDTIISVGESTVVGYIRNFPWKWIVRIGICIATGIVSIEDGIDGYIYSSFWRWETCVFRRICTSTEGDC